MSENSDKVVCYDSTVLSNFAYTDSIDVLLEIADDHITASQVIRELEKGYNDGYDFLENVLDYLPQSGKLSVSSETHPITSGTVNFSMHNRDGVEKIENAEMKEEYLKLLNMRDEIHDVLDKGEAHALYYFQNDIIRDREFNRDENTSKYIFATDDRDAREFAKKYDLNVTGSVGILAQTVKKGIVDTENANRWLSAWVEGNGYYSPVDDIAEIIDEI